MWFGSNTGVYGCGLGVTLEYMGVVWVACIVGRAGRYIHYHDSKFNVH